MGSIFYLKNINSSPVEINNKINRLTFTIRVKSEKGKGSTFIVSLPSQNLSSPNNPLPTVNDS